MGKFNNQAIWPGYDKWLDKDLDAYYEIEPPLTDEQRAQLEELERDRAEARWAYALPITRVRLFDEVEATR
ncbi:hypothetical protein [Paraburkholderia sp. RL18-085-BIA-A]|uniref:hypothetical protein n=1 Tax=Paraburkholderia sp. RL18-085-BIA-A TaxID=3031633 RepID=UPI0038B9A73C